MNRGAASDPLASPLTFAAGKEREQEMSCGWGHEGHTDQARHQICDIGLPEHRDQRAGKQHHAQQSDQRIGNLRAPTTRRGLLRLCGGDFDRDPAGYRCRTRNRAGGAAHIPRHHIPRNWAIRARRPRPPIGLRRALLDCLLRRNVWRERNFRWNVARNHGRRNIDRLRDIQPLWLAKNRPRDRTLLRLRRFRRL